jgi:hypothetical protein
MLINGQVIIGKSQEKLGIIAENNAKYGEV